MMEKVSTTATYLASSSAVVFGLTANELMALASLVIAFLTFLANLFFQIRSLRLQRDFYKTQMEKKD